GRNRPELRIAAKIHSGPNLPVPGEGAKVGTNTTSPFTMVSAKSAVHLWTPPSRQERTLGWLLRVVGCCHLSGLGCGRNTAAGLYGSSRTGSRSPKACSKHGGKPWLSQPRLADCCAILSFRSPLRLCAPCQLRRRGWSSVGAVFDQQGPDDAGHLVGQSDG